VLRSGWKLPQEVWQAMSKAQVQEATR